MHWDWIWASWLDIHDESVILDNQCDVITHTHTQESVFPWDSAKKCSGNKQKKKESRAAGMLFMFQPPKHTLGCCLFTSACLKGLVHNSRKSFCSLGADSWCIHAVLRCSWWRPDFAICAPSYLMETWFLEVTSWHRFTDTGLWTVWGETILCFEWECAFNTSFA